MTRMDKRWGAVAIVFAAASGCSSETPGLGTGMSANGSDSGSPFVVDAVEQKSVSPVDLLWVLDPGWTELFNPGSEEGNTLFLTMFNASMDFVLSASPDWSVGVLSADIDAGNMGRLRVTTSNFPLPDGATSFPEVVGPPHIRDALYSAFEARPDADKQLDFIRANSAFRVIVVTDALDFSGDDLLPAIDFPNWFNTVGNSATNALSVVTTDNVSSFWESVTDDLGGETYVLRDLVETGQALTADALGIQSNFPLSQMPELPLEEVAYIDRDIATPLQPGVDFVYREASNDVRITSFVPAPGSTVRVTYLPRSL